MTDRPPRSREDVLVDTFVRLADILVETYDVIDFLYFLCERCVLLSDVDEAAVMLINPSDRLQTVAGSTERSELLELFEVQNDGPSLDSLQTGVPITEVDLGSDRARTRWPAFAPHAVEVGYRAVHSVPLRLRATVIGALNVLRLEPGHPPDADLRLIQALADTATIGILQHRALDEAMQMSAGLQHALSSRVRIEQAKGMVAERGNTSIDDAFELLRGHARSNQMSLTDVAKAVLRGELAIGTSPRRD